MAESKRDSDSVLAAFFPAISFFRRITLGPLNGFVPALIGPARSSTMGDLLPQPESQFSLPLDRGSNGRCFYFRGYEWVTGASAHDMFNRVYSLVPGRCGMSGGRSEHDPTSKRTSPPRRSCHRRGCLEPRRVMESRR